MKIAVYTIAKNEEQFIQRWAESCIDADYRFILDTGSTDQTLDIAKDLNINSHVKIFTPWRFDHARNYALSLLPNDIDICIALDMDEILKSGWRNFLENIPKEITRPRYKYIWSWNQDGSEGLVYGADKIHARHGYKWEHPVHEVLKPDGINEVQFWVDGLEIHHHPDPNKSRSQYFDLLKLAVQEKPRDDRNQFYLAREYFFYKDYENATRHFKEFLKLSIWPPERAAACRYLAIMNQDKEEFWLYQAVSEDPNRRENWVALAMMYYKRNDWISTKSSCEMALRAKEKPLDYLCEANSWNETVYDLLALSYWKLGNKDQALLFGSIALEKSPNDQRLINNLNWYKK